MTVADAMTGVKVIFAHDTRWALLSAAALVNTDLDGADLLTTPADLTNYLDDYLNTGRRDGTVEELDAVRAIRPGLRAVWEVEPAQERAACINDLLRAAPIDPYLTRHTSMPEWHMHATPDDAPLVDRLLAEYALAFVDVMRLDEEQRLRICASQDCSAVLVDFSRNRSKRFCDIGNCGNREHVAAYRARKRG